jgi:phosphoribosylformylglycinamidine synthase
MLLTVPSQNLEPVKDVFEKEEVQATVIGELTRQQILLLNYRGVEVANLDVSFLFGPPRPRKEARLMRPQMAEPSFPEPKRLDRVLMQLLSLPNIASKESVVRTYDHEVKGNTVLKPLQGEFAGPNDASILKPLQHSWKGAVISCGMNPAYGKIDTYWMAASAIDEAVRNNVAVGGRRIVLLDNFTWGNPEKPERLGDLVEACKACYDLAKAYETPFISGKDSLYNESPLGPVTPTLLITALGIIPDIREAVSMDVKAAGDSIYIVGKTLKELGGSEYYRLNGSLGNSVPKTSKKSAKQIFASITKAIDLGLVRACHDLSEGGLAVAIAEMAFSGGYGAELDLWRVPRRAVDRDDFLLFSESNSRFLLEVPDEARPQFENVMRDKPFARIGWIIKRPHLRVFGINGRVIVDTPISDLQASWKRELEGGAYR